METTPSISQHHKGDGMPDWFLCMFLDDIEDPVAKYYIPTGRDMLTLILKTYCTATSTETMSAMSFVLMGSENDDKNPLNAPHLSNATTDMDTSVAWWADVIYRGTDMERMIYENISSKDLIHLIQTADHKKTTICIRPAETGLVQDDVAHTKQDLIKLPIHSMIMKSSIHNDAYFITEKSKLDPIFIT